jgi:hypothetical protein
MLYFDNLKSVSIMLHLAKNSVVIGPVTKPRNDPYSSIMLNAENRIYLKPFKNEYPGGWVGGGCTSPSVTGIVGSILVVFAN